MKDVCWCYTGYCYHCKQYFIDVCLVNASKRCLFSECLSHIFYRFLVIVYFELAYRESIPSITILYGPSIGNTFSQKSLLEQISDPFAKEADLLVGYQILRSRNMVKKKHHTLTSRKGMKLKALRQVACLEQMLKQ